MIGKYVCNMCQAKYASLSEMLYLRVISYFLSVFFKKILKFTLNCLPVIVLSMVIVCNYMIMSFDSFLPV